jgi:hypothetical protein
VDTFLAIFMLLSVFLGQLQRADEKNYITFHRFNNLIYIGKIIQININIYK